MNSRGIAQLAYEKGAYVLAAAQSTNAALELQRLGHGLLTYALVQQGIEGYAADHNGDGRITAQEWFRFAAERVPAEFSSSSDAAGRPFKVGGSPVEVQRPRAYFRRGAADDWTVARKAP